MRCRVPYIDYPRRYEKMRGEALAAIDAVLRRGNLMLREELRAF
jgi:hypothetical protein